MLVALITVVLLVPAALVGGLVARTAISQGVWQHSRRQAELTAAVARSGRLTATITPSTPGVDLVQVVAPGRRVIAASSQARGPALVAAWPTAEDPAQDVQVCRPGRPCLLVSALRVSPASGSPVVYAGRAAPSAVSSAKLDGLFAVEAVLLVALATWAAWTISGRTLRPVEAIRSELAHITASDLATRVPQPRGEDEIARLAGTINQTLERLERSRDAEQQVRAGLQRMLDQQRRFTSDASHELRTPLAGLRAQLEEAELHPDETDLPHVLQHALRDVDRLQAIITDLLLLAQVGAVRPGDLCVLDLSRLVTTETTRRAGDRHPVHLDVQPGVCVEVVPRQIARLLGNLLDNAQRHASRRVGVRLRAGGGRAELTVTDDGPGIPEADREVVFQRFTRLDTARGRDQGGTGLGLAIARDIARAHHGTLDIADASGRGACFVLDLPLADDHDGERAPTPVESTGETW
ncbi:sensor histidine kinase [Sphaerisporangium album]|uniref:sensor histidine kinase n=1 Tax=Sphaerisporangium album TaxID=509200 RepID=UPI001FE41718|nr:HAMP domain-containing sensor histidine kinase [Sphaerisporangium album]